MNYCGDTDPPQSHQGDNCDPYESLWHVCHPISAEGWRTVAFWATVIGWSLGGMGILSGVLVYVAKSNAEFLQKAPRTISDPIKPLVPSIPKNTEVSAARLSILIISAGQGEPIEYANQIAANITSVARVERFDITMLVGAETGVTFVANGKDPKPLLDLLNRAGISAKPSTNFPMLPIQDQSSQFILASSA